MRKNKALSKYLGGDKVEIVRPMRKKLSSYKLHITSMRNLTIRLKKGDQHSEASKRCDKRKGEVIYSRTKYNAAGRINIKTGINLEHSYWLHS